MNIVITGASSGVGYEAAMHLSADPANKVVALARSGDKLEKLSEAAFVRNPEGLLLPLVFDTIHGEYDKVLLPFLKNNLRHVDIIINNAGALVNKPFNELDQLDFVAMLQTNFLGHVKMIQHLLTLFPARG